MIIIEKYNALQLELNMVDTIIILNSVWPRIAVEHSDKIRWPEVAAT